MNYLPDNQQKTLREKGLISENEVAIKEGDKYIAENLLSRERRIINITSIQSADIQEHNTNINKRILKG